MSLDLAIRATPLGRHRGDAVVLLVGPGEDPRRQVAAAGRAFLAGYRTLAERETLGGENGALGVLHAGPAARIATLVLAPVPSDGIEAVRQATATGVRAARDAGARDVAVVLPRGRGPARRPDRTAGAAAEAGVLGLYRYETHKAEKAKRQVERLTLLVPPGTKDVAAVAGRRGRALGEAAALARDLGNEPANHATPAYLAQTAHRIAAEHGLGCEVLEREDMQRLGMGALLGVSQGSAQPPKLIVLTYEPRRRRRPETVALVGKGLTFDAGGISIKPSAKLDEMKFDMCGGAAVLGGLQACAALEVPVRVVGLVPASENLLGAAAYKPGDVLRAMNGVTIEVKNTDAEGRLILADALAYATTKLRPRPRAVIDIATLTGACVVALGDHCAGLVSNDDDLARRLERAGEVSGDPVWRLPLRPGHRKQMESAYADLSNLGTPGAGAITAAAFLERFAGRVPWAHLDIAGVAWTEKTAGTFHKGATGFGVRLFGRLLEQWGRAVR